MSTQQSTLFGASERKRVSIFEFWNSKIGLAIFGSIVVMIIVNFFNQWMENSKAYAKDQKQRKEIFSELNHRMYLLDDQFANTDQLPNREEKVAQIPKLAAITSGTAVVFTEAGQGKGLVELLAEYIKLDHGTLMLGESMVKDLIRMQDDFERSIGLNQDLQMARLNAARRKYMDFRNSFLAVQAAKRAQEEIMKRRWRITLVFLLIAAGSYPLYRLIQYLVDRIRAKESKDGEHVDRNAGI